MDDNPTTGSAPRARRAARQYASLDISRDPERVERQVFAALASSDISSPAGALLDFEFGRLFAYLADRKHWIAGALLGGAIAGFAFGVLSPSRFTASAEVLIDPAGLQVVSNDLYSRSDQRDAMVLNVESKMRVLTSGNVFRRVVAQLALTDDPEFVRSGVDPMDAAMRSMQERVNATRDEKSFVVTLSATSDDADKSVRIASAVIEAFRQELTESDAQGAGRAADSLTERLGALRDEVSKAEGAVEDFKRAHDLQTSQGELTSTSTMMQVTTQLLQAQAKLIDATSRYDKLTSGSTDGKASAAAQESNTISALRAQYAATEQQGQALKATLGPLHPNVRAVTAQVAALQSQIAAETARIVQAAKSDVEQSQAAVAGLQAQVDSSKSVVATDNTAQVSLRDLEREASSRAAIYEAFLDRARQITEREQIDTTNIRIISAPVAPTTRSSPLPNLQLAALGSAAGLTLGALAALGFGLLLDGRGERSVVGPSPMAPLTRGRRGPNVHFRLRRGPDLA